MFKRGDQVVCIFPGPWKFRPSGQIAERAPCLSSIYTVQDVATIEGIVGLRLMDIGKDYWAAHFFRPVVKSSFDFREHLRAPSPAHA